MADDISELFTQIKDAFENSKKPVFVVYGTASCFDKITDFFDQYLKTRKETFYIRINLTSTDKNFPVTYFEILQQLGDQVIEHITDHDTKTNLDDLFRLLRKRKTEFVNDHSETMYAELISFSNEQLYPELKTALQSHKDVIVGMFQVERIGDRTRDIDRFLLAKLPTSVRNILFVNAEDSPSFAKGADGKDAKEKIDAFPIGNRPQEGKMENGQKNLNRSDLSLWFFLAAPILLLFTFSASAKWLQDPKLVIITFVFTLFATVFAIVPVLLVMGKLSQRYSVTMLENVIQQLGPVSNLINAITKGIEGKFPAKNQ